MLQAAQPHSAIFASVRREIAAAMEINPAGCIAMLKEIVEYYLPPTLKVSVSPPETSTFFRGEEINISIRLANGNDDSPQSGSVRVRILFPSGSALPVGVVTVKGYEKFSEFDVAVDTTGSNLFIAFPQLSKSYGGSFIIEIESSGGQKWIFPVRVLCKRSHNSHRLRTNVSSSQALRGLPGFGKTLCERMERHGVSTIRDFAALTEPSVRALAKHIHSARSSMTLDKFLSAWKTARNICDQEMHPNNEFVGDNVDWQYDDSDHQAITYATAVPVVPAVVCNHPHNSSAAVDDVSCQSLASSVPPVPVAMPLVGCPSFPTNRMSTDDDLSSNIRCSAWSLNEAEMAPANHPFEDLTFYDTAADENAEYFDFGEC